MEKENKIKDILDFLSSCEITHNNLNLYLQKIAGKSLEELSDKALDFLFHSIGEMSIEIKYFISELSEECLS
jgi:hypothetical protein